jgi:endonuclease YncB( thermonuclease family)
VTETWDWPRATVVDHYDGDTFYADIDLGLELIRRRLPVRLAGIDTPELRPLQAGAKEALAYLKSLIPLGSKVLLSSVGYDKYGPRIDAIVSRPDGLNVNETMVTAGHAVHKDY